MSNYWTTKDGKVLRITEIPDDHLLNIVNYFQEPQINGVIDADGIDAWEEDPPEGYDECVLEAKSRGLLGGE